MGSNPGGSIYLSIDGFWTVKIAENSTLELRTFSGRGAIRMCLGCVCMQFGAVSGLVCVPEGRFCKKILKESVRDGISGDRFRRSERVSGR